VATKSKTRKKRKPTQEEPPLTISTRTRVAATVAAVLVFALIAGVLALGAFSGA